MNMSKTVFEKIKNRLKKIPPSVAGWKVGSLVVLIGLMTLPFGMDKMDLFNPEQASRLLYPFTALFSGAVPSGFHFFSVCCFAFFLLPIAFILTIISFFQKRITNTIVYLSLLVSVAFYLAGGFCGIILFANTARWFSSLSPAVYIAFFSALAFHSSLIAFGIISIKKKNESYVEYKQLLKEENQKETAIRDKISEKLKKRKKKRRRRGIRCRGRVCRRKRQNKRF